MPYFILYFHGCYCFTTLFWFNFLFYHFKSVANLLSDYNYYDDRLNCYYGGQLVQFIEELQYFSIDLAIAEVIVIASARVLAVFSYSFLSSVIYNILMYVCILTGNIFY